jgi:archaemetzincin
MKSICTKTAIGLTCLLFVLNFCTNRSNHALNSKLDIVYFEDFDTSILQPLKLDIKKFYGINTNSIRHDKLPISSYYKPRNRYRADSLIKYLKSNKTQSQNLVLGLCAKDISVSIHNAKDWGVFGFGYCPGNSCIASSFRLKKDSKPGYYSRLKNVVLHELGHNLGLKHCPDTVCLMVDARGKMSSIEGVNRKLCLNCKQFLNVK